MLERHREKGTRPEQGDRALVLEDPGCEGDVLPTGAVGTWLPSGSEL